MVKAGLSSLSLCLGSNAVCIYEYHGTATFRYLGEMEAMLDGKMLCIR